MALDPESLYLQLGQLVATAPDLNGGAWSTPEGRIWLGRAAALVEAAGDVADRISFNVASDALGTVLHSQNVQQIFSILYRTLAKAELAAPVALQGQFIPAGDVVGAFAAISKVFARAKSDLLVIDKFADQALITDFVVTAPENVQVRVLASDKETRKLGLRPAVERWRKQFETSRPLSVRVVPDASLHDRLILVDGLEAWLLGQSFNGIAQRSPTSVVRVDAELAAQKIAAYNAAWESAISL